jgi:hypothetical protein
MTIQKFEIKFLKILKISFDFVFERKKALNRSTQITLFYDFVKVVVKELIKKIGGPNRNSYSAQIRTGSLEREMQIF